MDHVTIPVPLTLEEYARIAELAEEFGLGDQRMSEILREGAALMSFAERARAAADGARS